MESLQFSQIQLEKWVSALQTFNQLENVGARPEIYIFSNQNFFEVTQIAKNDSRWEQLSVGKCLVISGRFINRSTPETSLECIAKALDHFSKRATQSESAKISAMQIRIQNALNHNPFRFDLTELPPQETNQSLSTDDTYPTIPEDDVL